MGETDWLRDFGSQHVKELLAKCDALAEERDAATECAEKAEAPR